jgi:hypothetical protein
VRGANFFSQVRINFLRFKKVDNQLLYKDDIALGEQK